MKELQAKVDVVKDIEGEVGIEKESFHDFFIMLSIIRYGERGRD